MWAKWSYLTWALAGLFLVFGVLIFATDDPSWKAVWAGLSLLSLGGWALATVRDGIETGVMRVRTLLVRRADKPGQFRFWAAVMTVTGVVVIVTGAWVLIFRT